jgi:hypothetical protein
MTAAGLLPALADQGEARLEFAGEGLTSRQIAELMFLAEKDCQE